MRSRGEVTIGELMHSHDRNGGNSVRSRAILRGNISGRRRKRGDLISSVKKNILPPAINTATEPTNCRSLDTARFCTVY
jgi:hypothetical protein